MLILIVLAVLFVLGLIISVLVNGIDWLEIPSTVIGVIAGVLLLIALISLPIERLDNHAQIVEFNAIKTTVEEARKRGNDFENAALQQKIITANGWLAKAKYYNTTVFDIWVPDKVNDLSPIK